MHALIRPAIRSYAQVLAYYWQLYLQNALQQGGGTLPMPFMGAPFMPPEAFAGQYQQQQPQLQPGYNGGRSSADGTTKKRSRDGGDGGSNKKGRRARNENKVGWLTAPSHLILRAFSAILKKKNELTASSASSP